MQNSIKKLIREGLLKRNETRRQQALDEAQKVQEEAERAEAEFEKNNPKLANLPSRRLYGVTDQSTKSIYKDKIERCVMSLPDSEVGQKLYTSLQTLLLKGN